MRIKKSFAYVLSSFMICMNQPIEVFAQATESELQEVLHLTFEDGTAKDTSGKGNDGTIHGAPTFEDGPNGKALHIVNNNPATSSTVENYVDFGTPADLQFGTEDFTISYLFKTAEGNQNGSALISNKDYTYGDNTGFAHSIFGKTSGVNFTPEGGTKADPRDLSDHEDAWHHAVVSYDRDGNIVGYLDGEEKFTKDISADAGKSIDAYNFVIGADGKFAYGTQNSYIDEVRVFKNAVTAKQAKALQKEAMPETTPETADEVLHLTFDDNSAKDSSTRNNDGTIAGNIPFVDGISGKAVHIANSNGSSSAAVANYINLGTKEDFHFGTEDFTIALWYRSGTGNESGGTIISSKDYNSGTNKGFALGSFTKEIRANLADGSDRKDIKFSPVDDAWHHSAVTFDRDGKMKVYTDGVFMEDADISAFKNLDIGASDLVIGADTNKKNGLLDSLIDEVHVYRSVKSDADIKGLYDELAPKPVDPPTPPETTKEVLYVNFDHSVTDESGSGNDGTITGNPAYTSGVVGDALHIVNENGSTSKPANQYVDFGKGEDLQFGTDNFSMSYWYRSDNGVSNGGAFISNKEFGSGGNTGFNLGDFDDGFRFNFTPQGSSRSDIRPYAPIDGVWHHVAINVDRSGSVTTFLDGKQAKTMDISSKKGSIDAGNFVVGADGYFKNGLDDAYIDELHVYRGIQDVSDIELQYHKERLSLSYQEAVNFYEKEHTNTQYDEPAMQALASAIDTAKAAIDASDYQNAETLSNALDQAVQAVKDSAKDAITGQVLYVSFDDESAKDASGRNNHGSVQGAITYTDGISGKAAHIVNKNGSTMNQAEQYINFKKASDLQFGTDDFAIGFWYKTNNGGGTEAAIISNKDWASGNNVGFTIGNFDTTSRVNFTAVQGERKDIYGMEINDDEWHYIVMNADRDHAVSAYVDGELFSSTDISKYFGVSIDAEDFVIGADGLKTQGINDAYIDEVRVFNRLMSEKEIEVSYLPSKLQLFIDDLEKEIAQAKADDYDADKIASLEKVINEVKEEQANASESTIRSLIERLENAYDYFKDQNDADFVFSVVSDVHITDNDRTSENSANLINALQDMKDLNPNGKAVVIPGDLTNGGGAEQYKGFYDIMDTFTPEMMQPIIALGNHDVRWLCASEDRNEVAQNIPTCKEGTSPFKERYLSGNQKYMGDVPEGQLYFDTWVDGYHFITLNTEQDLKDNAYLSQEQLTWLEEKLAEDADPEKPIFLQLHQTFANTADHESLDVVGEQEEQLKEIMSKYPQSVIFTGHVHNGIDLLQTYQGTWGHLVDVPCFWYKSYGDVDSLGIGYQVEVKGKDIKIRVRDYLNNTWLDEYEMNFAIDDPLPKDPASEDMDYEPSSMSVTAGSTHTGDDADHVLDNNKDTIWHTEWSGSTVEQNYLLFDLKDIKEVNGLRYLPRQNSTNGNITKYEIQISDDGKQFTKVAEGSWKGDSNWKLVEFDTVTTRYVKLIAIEAHNGTDKEKIASAAEVRITHPETVDKSELEKLINDSAAYKEADYTVATYETFKEALSNANTILAKDTATKEEVATAIQTLKDAIEGLEKVKEPENVDKSELENWIKQAQKLQKEEYTEESWTILQDELANACRMFEKEDAVQADVDAAASALQDAIAQLKENPVVDVDTSKLRTLYETYASIMEADYTKDSYLVFESAMKQAQMILNKQNANQQEVDAAYAALQSAIAQLKEVGEPAEPDEDPDVTVDMKDMPKDVTVKVIHLDEEALQTIKDMIQNDALLNEYVFERVFDIKFEKENGEYIKVEGDMVVSIKLSEKQLQKQLQIAYISENGEVTILPSWIKDGRIYFKTTHNSIYAVLSNKQPEVVKPLIPLTPAEPTPDPMEPSTPNTGDETNNLLWMSMLMLGAAGMYVSFKKRIQG